nr:uracil-DNA glycosylase [Saprospiraceae bacterium]
ANGLCFSVNRGVAIPASLKNIFKEIKRDLNIDNYKHGDLTAWADQGVFLLNTILTVEQGKAASHQNIGWNLFTDAVIEKISQLQDQVIFMLWGNHAKAKKNLIDSSKHYVLESVHPSPLAGGKFIGCGHFGQANELLKKHGKTPINWELPQ